MLANTEHLQPELVRERDFLHEVPKSLRRRNQRARFGVRRRLGKCINADLHDLS